MTLQYKSTQAHDTNYMKMSDILLLLLLLLLLLMVTTTTTMMMMMVIVIVIVMVWPLCTLAQTQANTRTDKYH